MNILRSELRALGSLDTTRITTKLYEIMGFQAAMAVIVATQGVGRSFTESVRRRRIDVLIYAWLFSVAIFEVAASTLTQRRRSSAQRRRSRGPYLYRTARPPWPASYMLDGQARPSNILSWPGGPPSPLWPLPSLTARGARRRRRATVAPVWRRTSTHCADRDHRGVPSAAKHTGPSAPASGSFDGVAGPHLARQ